MDKEKLSQSRFVESRRKLVPALSLAVALFPSLIAGACGAYPMGERDMGRLDRSVQSANGCPPDYIAEPQLPPSDSVRDPHNAPLINCIPAEIR